MIIDVLGWVSVALCVVLGPLCGWMTITGNVYKYADTGWNMRYGWYALGAAVWALFWTGAAIMALTLANVIWPV